jgi:glyoxylase-like metal-dependent hydrolase (beta-lactamase superfamily II)
MTFEIRGVVEGFYGPFYTFDEREGMLRFLAAHGMNYYLYGPKNDRLHRTRWRQKYHRQALAGLARNVDLAARLGIRFAYALSPVSMSYASSADLELIRERFRLFHGLGVRDFALFFDDVAASFEHGTDARHFGSFAQAHACLSNELAAWLRSLDGYCTLAICPTEYHGAPPFGDYLHELGACLLPDIDVFTTGPDVCCSTISAADVQGFAEAVGRAPILWDNYPVNDLGMQFELHLEPLRGRAADLGSTVKGIVANPMLQAEASKIPLATLAAYLADPAGYDPEAAWQRAVLEVAGEACAPALRSFVRAGGLKVLVDDFLAARHPGRPAAGRQAAESRLSAALAELDDARDVLMTRLENSALRSELLPWLVSVDHWHRAGSLALEVLAAQDGGEPTRQLVRAMEESVDWAGRPRRGGAETLRPLVDLALSPAPTPSATFPRVVAPDLAPRRGTHEARLQEIAPDLYSFRDTCQVYILRHGRQAVLVDFGTGGVLEELAGLGIERVSDVLMTHHHRDQGQGLARAVAAGARVWVPQAEQDLFGEVDAHWQARELYNNYNTRQDRFSLLEPVPVGGILRDYDTLRFGGDGSSHHWALTVLPTPGHTTGSVSLIAEVRHPSALPPGGAEGPLRVAFSGDLIAAPGKVWSMAATQWSYNGAEGVAATVASLLDLRERGIELLLPSHGEPIAPVAPAIDLLVERLWHLVRERRGENQRLMMLRQEPYVALTPHLLLNRTSMSNSYVLLSDSGRALVIDFGYDFCTGIPAGADRASRRPWLYTLPQLKRQFCVEGIDAVLPTHYHDDHVAGFNLLRATEGCQVWAAESMAPILEEPRRYNLPCLWYDPIPVDRRLPTEEPLRWQEYELTLYAQPGHTRHAVAISFEVDGQRVLAVGDQFEDDAGTRWNYVYKNGFEAGDYRRAAELYCRLAPDLILHGHFEPLRVPAGYLEDLVERAKVLESLHRDLLPAVVEAAAGGIEVDIDPDQATVPAGQESAFAVVVHQHSSPEGQPLAVPAEVVVRPVAPPGWRVQPGRGPAAARAGRQGDGRLCPGATSGPGGSPGTHRRGSDRRRRLPGAGRRGIGNCLRPRPARCSTGRR